MLNRQSCQRTVDRCGLEVKRRRKIFDHDSPARRSRQSSIVIVLFCISLPFFPSGLCLSAVERKRRPGRLGSRRLSPISGYAQARSLYVYIPLFPIPYNIIIRLMESFSPPLSSANKHIYAKDSAFYYTFRILESVT